MEINFSISWVIVRDIKAEFISNLLSFFSRIQIQMHKKIKLYVCMGDMVRAKGQEKTVCTMFLLRVHVLMCLYELTLSNQM